MRRGLGPVPARRGSVREARSAAIDATARRTPAAEGASRSRIARAWPLLPLLAALLYAGAATLLPRRPTLAAMVPPETILLRRFRDLAAYDAHETPTVVGGAGLPVRASAALGAELNLPGLPGIDRSRPLLEVTLPAERRPDPRFHVLPVADAAAVRARFRDPNLPERHARHVEVFGDHAAVAWDLDAVRHAGRGGGPWPAERGELWCAHADWPRFVDHCLRPEQVMQPTVLGALTALGFDPASSAPGPDGSIQVRAGRVLLVRDAWSSVTLWAFPDRMRAEVVPAAGSDLVKALADAVPDPLDADLPAVVAPKAQARLRARGAQGRRILAFALAYAGLRWPEAAGKDGFAALRLDAPGGLELWAEPTLTDLPFWTVGAAGPAAALPDPAALGVPAPGAGETAALADGVATLTAPYGGLPPAGEVARRAWSRSGRPATELVVLGIGAGNTADRVAASDPDAAASAWPAAPPPDEKGGRSVLLASFRLSQAAAARLLGRAVSDNGLLSSLRGAEIEGTLSTDGVRLILEANQVAR